MLHESLHGDFLSGVCPEMRHSLKSLDNSRWAKGEAAPTNRDTGRGISVNSHFDSGNIEVYTT